MGEVLRGGTGMAARAAGEGGVRRLGEEEGAYCVGDSVWSVGSGYKLIRLVGSGSYGQVCLAKDGRDEALVAVKRIPNIFSSMLNAKRVLREVCILRRLSHHPNIIKLRDVFTKPGSGGKFTMVDGKLVSETLDVYLVTDYYSNGDLYSLRTMLEPQQAKIIFKQVLEGVQFLHSCGVWHRDLKSGNVLLGDGVAKICDFGLARSSGGGPMFAGLSDTKDEHEALANDRKNRTQNSEMRNFAMLTRTVCTPCYRAPEVVMIHGSYTDAIDSWGLGCIFFELLQRIIKPYSQSLFQVPGGCDGRAATPSSDRVYQEEHQVGARRAAELDVIFDVLGTPTWRCVESIPSEKWRHYLNRIQGRPGTFDKLTESFDRCAVDLLRRLLVIDPSQRCMVEEALDHAYFEGLPKSELFPRMDNSLWGHDMPPPPRLPSGRDPNSPIVQTSANTTRPHDMWEINDPAEALEVLEAQLDLATEDADGGKGRFRNLLVRECQAQQLKQRGYFFGEKPTWWPTSPSEQPSEESRELQGDCAGSVHPSSAPVSTP